MPSPSESLSEDNEGIVSITLINTDAIVEFTPSLTSTDMLTTPGSIVDGSNDNVSPLSIAPGNVLYALPHV